MRAALVGLLVCVVGLGPSTAVARERAAETENARRRVERLQLASGWRVILQADRAVPLVAVHVRYDVGSADAPSPAIAQLAGRAAFLPAPAGTSGTTTVDADHLQRALLGPRQLLPALLRAAAPPASADVRLPSAAPPLPSPPAAQRRALATLHDLTFSPGHRYARDGALDEAVTPALLTAARAFLTARVWPSKGTVVVTGDFDPTEARRWLTRLFGAAVNGPPRVASLPPPRLEGGGERRMILRDAVDEPKLFVQWPTPGLFATGEAELAVAAEILGGGKASRLAQALVSERGLARAVEVVTDPRLHAGRMRIVVSARKGQDLRAIEEVVEDELTRLATTPPSLDELERAVNRKLVALYRRAEDLGSRAELLSRYDLHPDAPAGLEDEVDRLRHVTAAAIQRAVALLGASRAVVWLVPANAPSSVTAAIEPGAGR